MRKQDYLLHYIKSLNANERRYFKLNNKLQKGGKSYDALFDEMMNMDAYDAPALAKKLKKSESQLSSEKEYLEKVLLRTMRNFHEDSSIRLELMNRLEEVELLYNKHQFAAAMNKVEKVIKSAVDNELYELGIMAIRWHHITFQFLNKEVISNDMIALEKKLADQMVNEMEYRQLFYRFSLLINELEHLPGKKAEEKCRVFMQHPLLNDESKAVSLKAKIAYYRMLGDYHMRITYDNKQSTYYFSKAANLLEKNHVMMNAQIRAYLYVLQGLISGYSSTGHIKEAEAVVMKKEKLLTNNAVKLTAAQRKELTEMLIFEKMALLAYADKHKELIAYVESFDYRKAIEPFTPSHSYIFKFWVARAYVLCRMPGKALELCMQLLDNHPDDAISFMQSNYHLYLLVQFDLGNYTIMDSVLKNYARWRKKHKLHEPVYDEFSAMLKALVKARGKDETNKTINKYIQILTGLMHSLPNETIMSNIDLIAWLRNKLK